MKFVKTALDGAYIIELEKIGDERGFFSRLYCSNEFSMFNLKNNFVQVNNSLSKNKGTLRGIHYQMSPMAETKLVRCVQGALFDVIVDLRKDSPSYGKWHSEILNDKNKKKVEKMLGDKRGVMTFADFAMSQVK